MCAFKNISNYCSLVVFLSVVTLSANADTVTPKYVLAVFPYLPIVDLEKIYAPMAAELGHKLRNRVSFQSRNSFEEFRQELEAETYDIVFLQPFDYVEIAKKADYIPLARRDEPLSSVFVVANNSKISTVQDLVGKTIAMPPRPAAVSRLAEKYLSEHGLYVRKDVRVTYHKSHFSCLQQILIQKAAACATAPQVLGLFNKRMKSSLKSVFKTRNIPHVLFAAHKRVTEKDRTILLNAITSWDDDDLKKDLLRKAKLPAFVPTNDAEYDIVRKLFESQK